MEELGLDPESVELHEIDTEEEAERAAFPGSPTIRVEGKDLQAPRDEPIGLSCRVYRRADGSISPLPDPEEVRASLRAAATRD